MVDNFVRRAHEIVTKMDVNPMAHAKVSIVKQFRLFCSIVVPVIKLLFCLFFNISVYDISVY